MRSRCKTRHDGIVVTTDQGTTLLDGQLHQLSFTPNPNITDSISVTTDPANGLNGGLSVVIRGEPIAMSQSGDLATQLRLRDNGCRNS